MSRLVRGHVDTLPTIAWADLPPVQTPWQPVVVRESGQVVAYDPRSGRWVPSFLRDYEYLSGIDPATFDPSSLPAGWSAGITPIGSLAWEAGGRAWTRTKGATAPETFFFYAADVGPAGNDITIQIELTADVGLLVELVGTAIRFYGDAVFTSDRADYQTLIAATPAVAALIYLGSLSATNKLLAVNVGPTNLAYGSDVPELVVWATALTYFLPGMTDVGDEIVVVGEWAGHPWGQSSYPQIILANAALNYSIRYYMDQGTTWMSGMVDPLYVSQGPPVNEPTRQIMRLKQNHCNVTNLDDARAWYARQVGTGFAAAQSLVQWTYAGVYNCMLQIRHAHIYRGTP